MATMQASGTAASETRAASETGSASVTGPALPTTDALELVKRRAAWLGQGDGSEPRVSFTSLFLAILTSDDDLSLWAQDKRSWIGPEFGDVVRQWNLMPGLPGDLDENRIRRARGLAPGDLPAPPLRSTSSADIVVDVATSFALQVGSSAADVRHLLAAYLYGPREHDSDLAGWKLDREAWATRFRCYVTAAHPAEAAAWRKLHDDVFSRPYSTGIRESLSWATALARSESPQLIDARLLLHGVLLDGISHQSDAFASVQLVNYLGGRAAVAALIPQRPRSLPGHASSCRARTT